MRSKGSRNTLIKIDYDLIGLLAGISGNSAKQYANRGEFDSRSLDSALRWINSRRHVKGMPLIGLPTDNDAEPETQSDDDSSETVSDLTARTETGSLLTYDPMTADYRINRV